MRTKRFIVAGRWKFRGPSTGEPKFPIQTQNELERTGVQFHSEERKLINQFREQARIKIQVQSKVSRIIQTSNPRGRKRSRQGRQVKNLQSQSGVWAEIRSKNRSVYELERTGEND